MYVESVPNRTSPPAILLRESVRIGSKVPKRPLSNLFSWPAAQVDLLRRVLKGEDLIARDQAFPDPPISSSWACRRCPRYPSPPRPARSALPHSLPRARSHLRSHYRPHPRA